MMAVQSVVSKLWHRLSVLTLLSVFVGYVCVWLMGNGAMLFDPLLQNDDARTHLYPFHRFAGATAIAADPVAAQMRSMMTPGVTALYRLLLPAFDLPVAIKIVQFLCFAICGVAVWILIRKRQGGLALGLFFAFLLLHTDFVVNRIAGGMQRSFGFPALSLWAAGALTDSKRARYAALIIAALTYPSVAVLLMAAEVIELLFTRRALVKTMTLLAIVMGLLLAQKTINKKYGDVHTLQLAQGNPAFFVGGRLGVLPFPNPEAALTKSFFEPLKSFGKSPIDAIAKAYRELRSLGPILVIVMVVMIYSSGLSSAGTAALSLVLATCMTYAAARLWAFKLYDPSRYAEFGMIIAAIVLLAGTVGGLFQHQLPMRRATCRNFIAALAIALFWTTTGDGVRVATGMTISGKEHRALYDYVRQLGPQTRIVAHPHDADDIPLWSAKPTLIGYETIQPWVVQQWRFFEARAQDAFRMLYATDTQRLMSLCRQYGVTHILLRPDRYQGDFRRRADCFQPFGRFVSSLLATLQLEDLVLTKIPTSAVVLRQGPFVLVQVDKLATARP